MTDAPTLEDSRVDDLLSLISNSFRIRENLDPVYVDVGGHAKRLAAAQHLIVFGRRGSGKSCLLVNHHRHIASRSKILSIYLQMDEYKTLPYPDVLIRLLLAIMEDKGFRGRWLHRVRRPHRQLASSITRLRSLLDAPETAVVSDRSQETRSGDLRVGVSSGDIDASAGLGSESQVELTRNYSVAKLEELERHLADYKKALRNCLAHAGYEHVTLLVDDFYLLPQQFQPYVVDYLHRLCRGTDLYLKIGTVRHRTRLRRDNAGQMIGVELSQDVEHLDLDQTFEDVNRTRDYLANMLDSMAARSTLPRVSSTLFNPDGLLALTLASGGVPRDYLTIFVEAVQISREMGETRWLTPKAINKGAARVSFRTKLTGLRDDAGLEGQPLERVFQDILAFCLREKKKTAFLVKQEEVLSHAPEHEFVLQLMDFKLIHLIEGDTSAASGRTGRFEAYTLDFSLFMEPRKRNIEHVEFWKKDDQRRRKGVREAPDYPLGRARGAVGSRTTVTTEEAVRAIEAELEPADDAAD